MGTGTEHGRGGSTGTCAPGCRGPEAFNQPVAPFWGEGEGRMGSAQRNGHGYTNEIGHCDSTGI